MISDLSLANGALRIIANQLGVICQATTPPSIEVTIVFESVPLTAVKLSFNRHSFVAEPKTPSGIPVLLIGTLISMAVFGDLQHSIGP